MTIAANIDPVRLARAEAALAEKPDGIIEDIAARADVTPLEILQLLPEGAAVLADGGQFAEIWSELGLWGEVLLIVHTGDVVLEVTGALVPGTEAHGWFNIHGDSPIGGHIRKDNCTAIAFVDRAFHGRRSCSVWFLNAGGAAMFKIFVRRDAARELDPDQLQKFETLRDRAPCVRTDAQRTL